MMSDDDDIDSNIFHDMWFSLIHTVHHQLTKIKMQTSINTLNFSNVQPIHLTSSPAY